MAKGAYIGVAAVTAVCNLCDSPKLTFYLTDNTSTTTQPDDLAAVEMAQCNNCGAVMTPDQIKIEQSSQGTARKIKKGYIGVNTDVPVYDTSTTAITASNISNFFNVVNSPYYFAGSGNTFTSNNKGVNSSTAATLLGALVDMELSFTYSYSSEKDYDKFTLKVGSTAVEDAVSGSTTTKTWSGSVKKGDVIQFTYVKDNSNHGYNDVCTFSNMNVTTNIQTGTVMKSVARKIKKAYIGIGGKARPCWSGGELAYYGTVTPLSVVRSSAAGASVGNYALIAGGYNGSYLNHVDAYDGSLTMHSLDDTISKRTSPMSVSFGNYALFGGGYSGGGSYLGTVYAFDTSLVKTQLPIAGAKAYGAAAVAGSYALFGGGKAKSTSAATDGVYGYSSSLTLVSVPSLSTGRESLAATNIGGYALFGGGTNSGNQYDTVNSFDPSLTTSYITGLSARKYGLAATSVGGYALFGGGYGDSVMYDNQVDAYDKSMTKITATVLSVERSGLATTTVGNYALFGGGTISLGYSDTVDAYDESLTRSTPAALSGGRTSMAAASVGSYALFCGGSSTGIYKDTVDAYTIQ